MPYRLAPTTTTIRLSLRTASPSEVRIRQAEVATLFETLWVSMREAKPITLTHRQAVALSGEIFRAWSSEGGRTVSVQFNFDGTVKDITEENYLEAGAWESALAHLEQVAGDGDEPERLEPVLGTLGPVDS